MSEPIKIMLDRERTLQYDLTAIVDLDEATGLDFMGNPKESLEKVNARHLRTLLWAGLRHEDPQLTVEDAGRLVKHAKLTAVLDAVIRGLSDFFGEKKPDAGPSPGSTSA